MTALSLAVGGAALALGLVGYAGWRVGRPPIGSPGELLADGSLPTDRPVLVCLGDSITQGALGADWVDGLRRRLGDRALVVNAGVGGQVTWDLRQRLDEVARCRPAAVVLLAGSNDAVGALGGAWAAFYEGGRPQAPSEGWFAAEYDALVGELAALAPRVACLTLPPIGEDPAAPVEAIARRLNEAVRASAAARGADLLDVSGALRDLRAEFSQAPGVPFHDSMPRFMAWSVGSVLRRLLGQPWDRIAEGRGLLLTADAIHPSDRAAAAMNDLIEPWARRALSLGDAP